MNFNQPNKKSALETTSYVGGAVAGAAVSRGVFGAIHEAKAVTDADKKTEKMHGYAKRAAIIAVAMYGSSGLTGSDTGTQVAKGALQGMAVMQTVELLREATANSASAAKMQADITPKGKFIARTLGLACACDIPTESFQLNAYRNRRRLNAPVLTISDDQPAIEANLNPLEQAFQNGRISA